MAQVSDTDRDGIPNITDPFPTVNAVVADPDGNNNLSSGLQTGLIGRWDFESLTVSGSYHRFVDLVGGDQPLDCRQLSMGIDNAGMISKGALFDAGNDHLTAPGTLFHNRAAFTTSMWFKFPPGYVQNKPNNIHTVFFVCNNALDVYPELIVSIYKGIYGSTTQKIAVSRYDGTNIVVAYYGEIPIADHLDDGYWHHLAYVKNGTNSRLFVNGVKIKEANLMNSTLTSTTTGYICYGKSVPVATNQGHTFQGSMDRLRFYSRNLSETEVAELYRQDSDRDGHWDIVEKEWAGAFPMSPFYAQNPEFDTDRDGLPDNWERLHGLDPLSAVGVNGATGDSDNDGVTNIDEFQNNTNPSMNNTDGDGATDAVEIAQGSDPNNAADSGLPPIDPLESVTFRTGGDYATWRMNITGQGPRDFRELFVTAPNFNEFKTQIHKLRKNNSYRITLRHIASRPDLTDNWYCWEAQINGFPSTASFATTAANTLGTRTTEGMATIINNHWIADNSQGLLTTHLDSKNIDRATALTAYLLPVEVVVRKKAEATASETGLLVKKGAVITFDVNGAAPASTFQLPPETVKWKSRQLKHDGTTTNWTDVPGQGPELDFTTNETGVFEAKAVLTLQGDQTQDFPLTRKKDAPHADSSAGVVQDFHKAGAIDYFGVADAQWQIDVRNAALGSLGSEFYKNEGECVVQGSTTAPNPSNKCNIFIYHKCGDAGPPVPLTRGGIPGWRTGPPLAIDWWNDNSGRTDDAGRTITSFEIPNWSRLPDATMPQPGLIVAHPNLAGNPDQYSSHVGIFDYDGSWISAGFAKVNKYYHPKTNGYQPQDYRKYTGGN